MARTFPFPMRTAPGRLRGSAPRKIRPDIRTAAPADRMERTGRRGSLVFDGDRRPGVPWCACHLVFSHGPPRSSKKSEAGALLVLLRVLQHLDGFFSMHGRDHEPFFESAQRSQAIDGLGFFG